MSSFVFSTLGGGMRGISTIKSSNTTDEFAFATEKRILRKSFQLHTNLTINML